MADTLKYQIWLLLSRSAICPSHLLKPLSPRPLRGGAGVNSYQICYPTVLYGRKLSRRCTG